MTRQLRRLVQTSLAGRAYDELKNAILRGRLGPGTPLAEEELAQSLGISRTPVREALARLRNDGLVVALPGGGNAVYEPSNLENRELFLLLDALEQMALMELAEFATSSQLSGPQLSRLDDILEEQRQAQRSGNSEKFLDADGKFHIAICELAGLRRTAEILAWLRQRLRLGGTAAHGKGERRLLIIEEHAAIVQALRARNSVQAVKALQRHLTASQADFGSPDRKTRAKPKSRKAFAS